MKIKSRKLNSCILHESSFNFNWSKMHVFVKVSHATGKYWRPSSSSSSSTIVRHNGCSLNDENYYYCNWTRNCNFKSRPWHCSERNNWFSFEPIDHRQQYTQLLCYRKLTDSFTFTAIKAKLIGCEYVGFFPTFAQRIHIMYIVHTFPSYFVCILHAVLLQCENKLLAPIKTEVNFCEMCEYDVYTHFDCRINAICHLQRREMCNLNFLSFFFLFRGGLLCDGWLAVACWCRLWVGLASVASTHLSFNEMIFFFMHFRVISGKYLAGSTFLFCFHLVFRSKAARRNRLKSEGLHRTSSYRSNRIWQKLLSRSKLAVNDRLIHILFNFNFPNAFIFFI